MTSGQPAHATAPAGATMRPSDEATADQLDLARKQGDAFAAAVAEMTRHEARGGTQRAGDYVIGWAAEQAEGMYQLDGGELQWMDPGDANAHLEIVVCDAADGRFVPGLRVTVTLWDEQGNEVGTHEQPFLWHPWLYHYGRNWSVPREGQYRLKVRVEPPAFMRHDRTNGRRYAEPVACEFPRITLETGRKQSPPPEG